MNLLEFAILEKKSNTDRLTDGPTEKPFSQLKTAQLPDLGLIVTDSKKFMSYRSAKEFSTIRD